MTELGGGFDIYAHLRERPGAHMSCPHCNGVSGVNPDADLIMVCKLCGGPRIPMPDGAPLDPLALAQLKKANKARRSRGLMGGLGVVAGVSTAFAMLVTLLTWLIGTIGYALVPTILFVLPSIALLLFARAQRSSAKKDIAAAIDAAWVAAGADLVRSGKVKTAGDLTKVIGLDPIRAQQVFTLLSVEADIGAPNVRIDGGPVVSQVPVDARFAALEAKAAAEQQAEAEAGAAGQDARAKGRTN